MSRTGKQFREITLARREARAIIRPADEVSRQAFIAYGRISGVHNFATLVVVKHGWSADQTVRFWTLYLKRYATNPDLERLQLDNMLRGLARRHGR